MRVEVSTAQLPPPLHLRWLNPSAKYNEFTFKNAVMIRAYFNGITHFELLYRGDKTGPTVIAR